jgi:hypothetical protein
VGSIRYRCRPESSAPVVLPCFRGDLLNTLERVWLTFSPSALRIPRALGSLGLEVGGMYYHSTPSSRALGRHLERLTPTLAACRLQLRRPYLTDSKHLA